MTTLYEKHGRRYRVWGDHQDWHRDGDTMRIGEARMVVCTAPGAYRYTYNVEPDLEGFTAAAQFAAAAMVDKMVGVSQMRPAREEEAEIPYTPEQKEILEKFIADMTAAGGFVPYLWTQASPSEVVQAGIDALLSLRKGATLDSSDGEPPCQYS